MYKFQYVYFTSRVLMQCTYIGNYDEEHKEIKKRRMVGSEIKKALEFIVDNGKSCESY